MKAVAFQNGNRLLLLSFLFLAAFSNGCSSAYYKTMEMFGHHKREILVDRVEDARDAQTEAKEQFRSALERFSAVTEFEGGELEEKYKSLRDELDKSESKAEAVRYRIDKIENVAEALFKEWEDELSQYGSDELKKSSKQKLEQTREQYQQLINAMQKAEDKMEPVLVAFRDNVLYLKHNLNAQAVASLRDELGSVQADVASLIKEMETSIAEAEDFIKSMTGQ